MSYIYIYIYIYIHKQTYIPLQTCPTAPASTPSYSRMSFRTRAHPDAAAGNLHYQ